MPRNPRSAPARIAWHPVEVDADDALRALTAEVAGVSAAAVRVGRLCGACGSDSHGRPWARVPAPDGGRRDVGVSVSRSGPHLLVAVRSDGAVGVDVESVAAVARAWSPEVVLAPGEAADTDDERAWVWAAKEARLKLLGTGLRTPMTSIRASATRLAAPHGYVAALA